MSGLMGCLRKAAGEADPYWNNVLLLLVAGASDVIDAKAGRTLTTVGSRPVISSAQTKFNTNSIYFDGGDALYLPHVANDWRFGTGDLTIELWFRPDSVTAGQTRVFIDTRETPSSDGLAFDHYATQLSAWGNNKDMGHSLTEDLISANTWYHAAWTRASGTVRMFLNGDQQGGTLTRTDSFLDDINTHIGRDATGVASYFAGYMDELRVTKGVARYISDFTPPITRMPRR